MASSTSFLYFALLFASILHSSATDTTPQEYVDAHNNARVAANVTIPLVTWDTTVAAYAQTYANQRKVDCALTASGGPYGENVAKSSLASFNGISAFNMWMGEKPFYDYSTNTCATGKVCWHYTQVVWRNTLRIGCAAVTCNNNAGRYVICSYDPPGNVAGQMPY